jgi:hypothetical protein
MSGPYENPQLLDDICRALLKEKETASGVLLAIFYENGLGEIITGTCDMTLGLDEVERKLRAAADKVAELRAKEP